MVAVQLNCTQLCETVFIIVKQSHLVSANCKGYLREVLDRLLFGPRGKAHDVKAS